MSFNYMYTLGSIKSDHLCTVLSFLFVGGDDQGHFPSVGHNWKIWVQVSNPATKF